MVDPASCLEPVDGRTPGSEHCRHGPNAIQARSPISAFEPSDGYGETAELAHEGADGSLTRVFQPLVAGSAGFVNRPPQRRLA